MPQGVPVEYPIEVRWEGGMQWSGGPGGMPSLRVDGSRATAPSPVDALLVSMAACSGVDVVDYLEKRRTPPSSVEISVRFSRAPSPPRRVTRAHLVFRVTTEADAAHVERAVRLSFEKYCSVSNTFAPDTEITWEVAPG